jgi:hypothetical protein
MERSLLRQVRILQVCVLVLLATTALLTANLFRPLLPVRHFNVIEAHKVNILAADGTLKASISNAQGIKVFGRAHQDVSFSGLMFYNQGGR